MRDISSAPNGGRFYGGLACQKSSVVVDGKYQMVKYPARLRDKNFKNVVLSYSNSSVSEYLGSKIYELFGVPTHKVELVIRNGKLCAMCEDFVTDGRLVEFREMLSTDEDLCDTAVTGNCTDLTVILNVLQKYPELLHRFWQMFVIDALIGNHDRNTGNFGILSNGSVAPVYDNSNCLNPTWDDSKMLKHMDAIDTVAYKAYTCTYTSDGKEINPFQYLSKRYIDELSIIKHVPFIYIEDVVLNTETLSQVQKDFYVEILFSRFNKLWEVYNDTKYI